MLGVDLQGPVELLFGLLRQVDGQQASPDQAHAARILVQPAHGPPHQALGTLTLPVVREPLGLPGQGGEAGVGQSVSDPGLLPLPRRGPEELDAGVLFHTPVDRARRAPVLLEQQLGGDAERSGVCGLLSEHAEGEPPGLVEAPLVQSNRSEQRLGVVVVGPVLQRSGRHAVGLVDPALEAGLVGGLEHELDGEALSQRREVGVCRGHSLQAGEGLVGPSQRVQGLGCADVGDVPQLLGGLRLARHGDHQRLLEERQRQPRLGPVEVERAQAHQRVRLGLDVEGQGVEAEGLVDLAFDPEAVGVLAQGQDADAQGIGRLAVRQVRAPLAGAQLQLPQQVLGGQPRIDQGEAVGLRQHRPGVVGAQGPGVAVPGQGQLRAVGGHVGIAEGVGEVGVVREALDPLPQQRDRRLEVPGVHELLGLHRHVHPQDQLFEPLAGLGGELLAVEELAGGCDVLALDLDADRVLDEAVLPGCELQRLAVGPRGQVELLRRPVAARESPPVLDVAWRGGPGDPVLAEGGREVPGLLELIPHAPVRGGQAVDEAVVGAGAGGCGRRLPVPDDGLAGTAHPQAGPEVGLQGLGVGRVAVEHTSQDLEGLFVFSLPAQHQPVGPLDDVQVRGEPPGPLDLVAALFGGPIPGDGPLDELGGLQQAQGLGVVPADRPVGRGQVAGLDQGADESLTGQRLVGGSVDGDAPGRGRLVGLVEGEPAPSQGIPGVDVADVGILPRHERLADLRPAAGGQGPDAERQAALVQRHVQRPRCPPQAVACELVGRHEVVAGQVGVDQDQAGLRVLAVVGEQGHGPSGLVQRHPDPGQGEADLQGVRVPVQERAKLLGGLGAGLGAQCPGLGPAQPEPGRQLRVAGGEVVVGQPAGAGGGVDQDPRQGRPGRPVAVAVGCVDRQRGDGLLVARAPLGHREGKGQAFGSRLRLDGAGRSGEPQQQHHQQQADHGSPGGRGGLRCSAMPSQSRFWA